MSILRGLAKAVGHLFPRSPVAHDWTLLPTVTVDNRGRSVTLRPLRKTDEQALGDYFLGLSPQSRRVYAPHPFDRATAASICHDLDTPAGSAFLRLVAEAGGTIVGYFILYIGIHKGDRDRRYTHLNPDLTCTLAPSVTDAWQNSGLGSQLMTYAKDCGRHFGRTTMILWGGVREENARAVHFYEKHGFRRHGEFITTDTSSGKPEPINNIDMSVEL